MKELTLYDKIQNNARLGYYTVVKTEKREQYCIISPFKDDDGNYRRSGWYEDLSDCKENIGKWDGCEEDAWIDVIYIYQGVYIPTYEHFKPGDKVIVREDAEERCKAAKLDWNSYMQVMVGKVCEVKVTSGSDYWLYTPDSSDYWCFPPEALEPYYEDTPKETINIGGTTYEVTDELKDALKGLKEVK